MRKKIVLIILAAVSAAVVLFILSVLVWKPHKTGGITFVKPLQNAPFPYEGRFYEETEGEREFFDYTDKKTGVKYHTNRYGVRYSREGHYDDGSVLFHIPTSFNPGKPFMYVVFLHGHETELEKTVNEYQLIRQTDESGKNVIFIAPQLAKNTVDSSPGKFFQKGSFKAFMDEALGIIGNRIGSKYKKQLSGAPVVLVAFSGGYKSAAYILDRGGGPRIRGVILMDALYEEVDKFKAWAAKNSNNAFFVSLYTKGSCEHNNNVLMHFLADNGIAYENKTPNEIKTGDFYFYPIKTDHLAVLLNGPPKDPLSYLLKISDI